MDFISVCRELKKDPTDHFERASAVGWYLLVEHDELVIICTSDDERADIGLELDDVLATDWRLVQGSGT